MNHMKILPYEEIEQAKIRDRLALAEEYRRNPKLGKAHLAALFPKQTEPPLPLGYEPDTDETLPAFTLPS